MRPVPTKTLIARLKREAKTLAKRDGISHSRFCPGTSIQRQTRTDPLASSIYGGIDPSLLPIRMGV